MEPAPDRMELPPFKTRGASFSKTCFNGLNTLSGIGLITLPYTLAQGGWLSLAFLLAMAIITCYTGLLLQRCMESNPSIKSYPEIGWQAFGPKGRLIVSIFLYLEVFLAPTGFLILEGDNLHKLFPNVGLAIGGHSIGGKKCFTMVAGLVILPSMWLKDLSLLSFVSAGGVLSTYVIICSILWVGAVDGVGFSAKGELFSLSGIPTALSLYAFSYAGHPVFPVMYTSMEDKNQFSKVLFISFGFSTLSYISMAVLGYLMFGQSVPSQVTLDLPTDKISSKIALYTTLVGPIAKYALIISPLANRIEESLPARYSIRPICILMRTLLLLSSVVVALVFPFFGILLALVGAILNVTVSVLLPCICYLKISEAYRRLRLETVAIVGIVVTAISVGLMGAYSSLQEIIKRF